MRDDFSKETKSTLQKRVGSFCSNPKCQMLTVEPHQTETKSTNIGVAAHITAASRRGPRYDDGLTAKERKSIKNAIWLCVTCSTLVDRDPKSYPVELLEEWKRDAEKRAGEMLNRQISSSANVLGMDLTPKEYEPILPNGYYERKFGNDGSQTARVHLDGDKMYVEHDSGDGWVAYYVIDSQGNLIDVRLPYDISEYDYFIEPDLILDETEV